MWNNLCGLRALKTNIFYLFIVQPSAKFWHLSASRIAMIALKYRDDSFEGIAFVINKPHHDTKLFVYRIRLLFWYKQNDDYQFYSPLADNFFVLIILAANSSPVCFWIHFRTTEKAPLQKKTTKINYLNVKALNVYIPLCT